METESVEHIFVRAWSLLSRNWVMLVPGIAVGLVVGILGFVLVPGGDVQDADPLHALAEIGSRIASGIILGTVAIAGFVVTQCYTAGMAAAAWTRGTATLDDGAHALRDDAGHVFLAAVALLLTGLAAVILAIPTLGISLLAFYVFSLYTIAAAVVGRKSGFAAVRESVTMARARFGPTLMIAVLLVAIRVAGGWFAAIFSFAPLIGPLFAAVAGQMIVVYATLVVVGEYLNLRAAEVPAPPAVPEP